jgi:hypothetical protein
MLLNPTFFNTPKLRAASLPSANGHFSARALTAFYESLSSARLFPSSGGLAPRLQQVRPSWLTRQIDRSLFPRCSS